MSQRTDLLVTSKEVMVMEHEGYPAGYDPEWDLHEFEEHRGRHRVEYDLEDGDEVSLRKSGPGRIRLIIDSPAHYENDRNCPECDYPLPHRKPREPETRPEDVKMTFNEWVAMAQMSEWARQWVMRMMAKGRYPKTRGET